MVSMSAFMASSGMNTLLRHAVIVDIGEMGTEHEYPERYFVDVRLHFKEEPPCPFLKKKNEIKDPKNINKAFGATPTPKKMVSIMSDEGTPTDQDVQVSAGCSLNFRSRSPSNSFTDHEFSAPNDSSVLKSTLRKPVYIRDDVWIARTMEVSEILKEQISVESTEKEGTVTNSISFRGEVRALEPNSGNSIKEHGDVSNNIQSGLIPPPTQNPPLSDISKEGKTFTQKDISRVPLKGKRPSGTCAQKDCKLEDEDVSEIQPSHPQPLQKVCRVYFPDPVTYSDDKETKTADEQPGYSPKGGLLKWTSNLARKFMRKLSLRDARSAQRGSAGVEKDTEVNEIPKWLSKFRSWFSKKGSEASTEI